MFSKNGTHLKQQIYCMDIVISTIANSVTIWRRQCKSISNAHHRIYNMNEKGSLFSWILQQATWCLMRICFFFTIVNAVAAVSIFKMFVNLNLPEWCKDTQSPLWWHCGYPPTLIVFCSFLLFEMSWGVHLFRCWMPNASCKSWNNIDGPDIPNRTVNF